MSLIVYFVRDLNFRVLSNLIWIQFKLEIYLQTNVMILIEPSQFQWVFERSLPFKTRKGHFYNHTGVKREIHLLLRFISDMISVAWLIFCTKYANVFIIISACDMWMLLLLAMYVCFSSWINKQSRFLFTWTIVWYYFRASFLNSYIQQSFILYD